MSSKNFGKQILGALAACGLCAFLCAPAQAYQLQTVFKTEHYAINQVILDDYETLDAPLQSSITGDVQAQNRLNRLYQSTTVIFPAKSEGYVGKINTPVEAILSISNYGSGKDRIIFNRNVKYSSDGGIYLSFKQILEMVNQKVLSSLIKEFTQMPLVITELPVSNQGLDPTTGSYFITAVDNGVIIDLRVDDSVYYSHEAFYPANGVYPINKSCKVDVLVFVDRLVNNVPMFMSGRAAINRINCSSKGEAQNNVYSANDITNPPYTKQ